VAVVADGAEAWSHLQAAQSKGTLTLAILDWMMPHLDGLGCAGASDGN
jgi:DNA-binding response OmpR family regulator